MARCYELCERSAVDSDELLLECDPFVATEQRRAETDLAIASAQLGRNMGDLEAARLALANRAAEKRERLQEEVADEVRLQLAGLGTLHLVSDPLDIGGRHDVAHQCALTDDLAQQLAD